MDNFLKLNSPQIINHSGLTTVDLNRYGFTFKVPQISATLMEVKEDNKSSKTIISPHGVEIGKKLSILA